MAEIERTAPNLKALDQYEVLQTKEKEVTEKFEAARKEEREVADKYNAVKQRRYCHLFFSIVYDMVLLLVPLLE
jgi:structural maintenance of chromosome 1